MPGAVQERPDISAAVQKTHSRQPGCAGTAKKAHQDSFGLIIGMMGYRNGSGIPFQAHVIQKFYPCPSACIFQVQSIHPCNLVYINPHRFKRKI
jgi:hypothetical protein